MVKLFSEVIRVYCGDQTKLHSRHNHSSIVFNIVVRTVTTVLYMISRQFLSLGCLCGPNEHSLGDI